MSNQQTMQFADIFQSTLSVRRATLEGFESKVQIGISIHALREESDRRTRCTSVLLRVFQSTLSVRRATQTRQSNRDCRQFQSTLSVRRATVEIEAVAKRLC